MSARRLEGRVVPGPALRSEVPAWRGHTGEKPGAVLWKTGYACVVKRAVRAVALLSPIGSVLPGSVRYAALHSQAVALGSAAASRHHRPYRRVGDVEPLDCRHPSPPPVESQFAARLALRSSRLHRSRSRELTACDPLNLFHQESRAAGRASVERTIRHPRWPPPHREVMSLSIRWSARS